MSDTAIVRPGEREATRFAWPRQLAFYQESFEPRVRLRTQQP